MDQTPPRVGLFSQVFDLSFSTFITTRIVKILMVLGTLAIALWALVWVVAAFVDGVGSGLLALILMPLFAAIALLALRVYLELIIVIFRIAENTTELVRQGSRRAAPDA